MKFIFPSLALAFGLALAPAYVSAQDSPPAAPTATEPAGDAASEAEERKKEEALLKSLGAQYSGVGKIGSRAEVQIPEGFIFFGPSGTKKLLKQWGNLIGGNEDGMLTHKEEGWSVVFEFDDVGYVKDDDKDELNADKMMKMFKDSEPDVNAARKESGLSAQHILGFSLPPRYNPETNNLEWALRFSFDDVPGEQLNHNTKLLGRKGVMQATLLCGPDEVQKILPAYQSVLTGFQFNQGETYAEFRSGDKVATYGLVGLVAGGAAFAAGKAGLFAKLGVIFAKFAKFIIAGVVAVALGIKKLFGGGKSTRYE
ncbi:MAG: DUF2167 domain-containing protein [Verrucomicrobium sp.]|nr:DUF2167 domain-containing protein [Verrucomicrobium sp.]